MEILNMRDFTQCFNFQENYEYVKLADTLIKN